MDTKQVLILDCREQHAKDIVQKVLRLIKPLSKYSTDTDVPISALEKMISVMTNKYLMQPQWIVFMCNKNECAEDVNMYYSCGVKTSDTHEWLGSVTGCTVYELFAKLVILMYSQIKNKKVGLRNEDG